MADDDDASEQEMQAIEAMRERDQKQQQKRPVAVMAQPQAPPPQYVPLWSNLQLPPQAFSKVAYAAHVLRFKADEVPENPALAPSKRRNKNDSEGYRTLLDPQANHVYHAYLSMSLVTVLHRDGDAKLFAEAEMAELSQAAAIPGSPSLHHDAATPRNLALTLLISKTSVCMDRAHLIDCMAFLSHTGEPKKRAARKVRMAVLTNEQAKLYTLTTKDPPLSDHNHTTLTLAYVADDGSREVRHATLKHCGQAKKVLAMLIKAIASLFHQASLPLPPELAPDSEVDALEGAFVQRSVAMNKEFWKRLSWVKEAPKLDYELRFGKTEEHQTFVKLQPRQLPSLDDPDVYFGMLMFREGMDDAKDHYVTNAMQHERFHNRFPPEAPVGLRPPNRQEAVVCAHILSMRSNSARFAQELCCFTHHGALAKLMTPLANASMPSLAYALDPYTEEFKGDNWVFPCTQDQIDEERDLHCKAQWQAAMQGFAKYASICGLTEHLGDDAVPVFEVKTKKLKGLASVEDEALQAMVGMPLGSAFRLGEVNAAVSRTQLAPDVIRAYLAAFIARLGSNASMADALQACVDLETERVALTNQVDLLQTQQTEAPAAAPACSGSVADMCLEGMKLKVGYGMSLPPPMRAGYVIGIGRILNKANPRPPPAAQANDAAVKKHCPACKDMNTVETAAYLAHRVHAAPLFVLVVLEGGEVECHKPSSLGDGQTKTVSLVEVMEAFAGNGGAPPMLLKYDVELKKLNALVSK
ncbi:MAG: hypothetical protein CMB11_00025 [Euryarchaeota archaeon]|nr:hypothetical protein [Euryarchaeota archaeon]